MGQVYRATDTRLKRQVAIKILPPSLAADDDRLARFQREAEVLASLHQYDVTANGQRFLLNLPVDETPDFPPITVVLNWTAGLRK